MDDLVKPKPELPPSPFLTVCEVAALLRISRATVYRLIHDSGLPAFKVGGVGDYRIDGRQLKEWLYKGGTRGGR